MPVDPVPYPQQHYLKFDAAMVFRATLKNSVGKPVRLPLLASGRAHSLVAHPSGVTDTHLLPRPYPLYDTFTPVTHAKYGLVPSNARHIVVVRAAANPDDDETDIVAAMAEFAVDDLRQTQLDASQPDTIDAIASSHDQTGPASGRRRATTAPSRASSRCSATRTATAG
jgi:hypothetical protein